MLRQDRWARRDGWELVHGALSSCAGAHEEPQPGLISRCAGAEARNEENDNSLLDDDDDDALLAALEAATSPLQKTPSSGNFARSPDGVAHSNTGTDLRRANTGRTPSDDWVNEIANNAVTGALVGRTRGYNGEGNAAPRRRSSIDAGLARPNQLGESLSQLVQAADDAEGVPY